MGNLGGGYRKRKVNWDKKYGNVFAKNKVEVRGINLPQLIKSREVIANFHLFEKTDGMGLVINSP